MGKGEGFTCTNCGARNFWNPFDFVSSFWKWDGEAKRFRTKGSK